MKILVHYITDGFESCIQQDGVKYRAGWRSSFANNFTFVNCPFQRISKSVFGYRKHQRVNIWTTFSAANKQYQEMIKNSQTVNFK